MAFLIGGFFMYDQSYYINQALLTLGIPISEAGEDFSGYTTQPTQVFQRALDDMAVKTGLKMNKKRVTLPLDANKQNEYGIIPGDFSSLEFWYILPVDFFSLIAANVMTYRISGNHIITTETIPEMVIEYNGKITPADIPNNMRNLFILILAKYTAFTMSREEKAQMCESLIDKEMITVKLSTPDRKQVVYNEATLKRY